MLWTIFHIFVAIVIGGIAGTIAGKLMKSENGILIDIILGIVGGAIAKALFSLIGIGTQGVFSWVGDIIFGVIGACLVIVVVRAIRKK